MDKVNLDIHGQTIKLKAEMEIKDRDGNTRISKIFRDITLPTDCDAGTLSAKMIGPNMVLSSRKNPRPNLIPFNQREKPDVLNDDVVMTSSSSGGVGGDDQWDDIFSKKKRDIFGGIGGGAFNDTLNDMEKTRKDFILGQRGGSQRDNQGQIGSRGYQSIPQTTQPSQQPPRVVQVEPEKEPEVPIPPKSPHPSNLAQPGRPRSRGSRVRFVISDDEDEINIPVDQKQTEKPSKEAAREFLTGKLPSTIRVNVDHDPQR